ncbi:hypothetical protein JW859_06615 [bacterium]|nr:hypothetical protein [bacterium]
MDRQKDITELAALLDGELDAARAEQLANRLKEDRELEREFAAQREVKAALMQLPQYEEPEYLDTRVLGMIGQHRNQAKVWRWRTLAAALGGFTLCLVMVAGIMYMNQPAQPMYVAERTASDLSPETGALPPGTELMRPAAGMPYVSGYQRLEVPAGTGQDVKDFLEFANEAHGYSKLVNSTESLRPDIKTAILVLDGEVSQVLILDVDDDEDVINDTEKE